MNIKLIHLLSDPLSEREVRSINCTTSLAEFGIHRVEMINPKWVGEVPGGHLCSDGDSSLNEGRYGCWKAHRDAILKHLDNVDGLIICEADCLFSVPTNEVYRRIEVAIRACREGNLTAFTFGFRHNGKTIDHVGQEVIVINQWIGTECYFIPIGSKQIFIELFSLPWDAYDLLITRNLCDLQKRRIGTFSDRPIAVQANGVSLITGGTNTFEDHFINTRY